MAFAVPQLSPVTMMLAIFMDFKMEMAARALGFRGSETAKSPVSSLFTETRIPV
ncbi:hypothetical protein YC2023_117739 [Brassica napus]